MFIHYASRFYPVNTPHLVPVLLDLPETLAPLLIARAWCKCLQDMAEGDIVFRIPMRLALSDYEGDKSSEGLTFEGAPWSVRLACCLLRERAAGAASAWFPYLQVINGDHRPEYRDAALP